MNEFWTQYGDKIVQVVVALICGGGVTILGIRVNFPGFGKAIEGTVEKRVEEKVEEATPSIKEKLTPEIESKLKPKIAAECEQKAEAEIKRRTAPKEIHLRYTQDVSYHPCTVVRVMKTRTGGLLGLEVFASNQEANRFFGNASEKSLEGMSNTEMAERLQDMMQPDDFHRFGADQSKLLADVKSGRQAFAKIPIRLKNGETWIPVVVGTVELDTVESDNKEELMTVLYFNLKTLDRNYVKELLERNQV